MLHAHRDDPVSPTCEFSDILTPSLFVYKLAVCNVAHTAVIGILVVIFTVYRGSVRLAEGFGVGLYRLLFSGKAK